MTSFLPFEELGVEGAKVSGGFVLEDFLPELRLDQGRRVYREMRDNDSTVNASIFAIEMILRAVNWTIEENPQKKGTKEAYDGAQFVEGVLFNDMSHTWDDFITEALSSITFGWEFTEVVYKRRLGPDRLNPQNRSIYNDGAIGIRKLVNIAQETTYRWEIDETGGVRGLWQQPPVSGSLRYIPIEKALLFRPHPQKGSPEGRSILRGAYRPWYFLKRFQEQEAIAVERELNGLPVISIPNKLLKSEDPKDLAAKEKYLAMGRDVKFNSQGCILIPSDTFIGKDDQPTNIRVVDFRLASSEGTRNIDIGLVILRCQREIARTILADFIMLGSTDRGSFALSKDKSSLFIKALEGWGESISETVNRHLLPKLWKLNNFDLQYIPYLKPGPIASVNINEIAQFISSLAKAGAELFPDDNLENSLRSLANLPDKPPTMNAEDLLSNVDQT